MLAVELDQGQKPPFAQWKRFTQAQAPLATCQEPNQPVRLQRSIDLPQ